MKNYFNVNGKIIAKPGKRDDLLSILLEVVERMNDVDDCFCYIVGTDPNDSDSVHIYEVWIDESAHKKSLTMNVFQEMIEKARPLIAGMEDQPNLSIHGGKVKKF